MRVEHFDFVVVGGGIFGCYAALHLAGRGAKVAILEKEARLFQKASLVNQARLHGGYHYPRSVATAAMSDEHKMRFTEEHRAFVNHTFEKFYAIDRYGSFTDGPQFERFCAYLQIPCERVEDHKLFNFNRLEALYRTEEHSFDPVLLGNYYREKVENTPGITVFKNTQIQHAEATGNQWLIETGPSTPQPLNSSTLNPQLSSPTLINATYAATNATNKLFGVHELALTHEISEIAFVSSPQFGQRGLTVMDGPFGSIMPYGLSGLLSLSSVAYTHHKISFDALPHFDCQQPETDPACRPEAPGICTECPRRPVSNAPKMLAQMQQYFADNVQFAHLFSYYTIKSKLKASHIDDGRPTEISLLRESPRFYCLFAGKINSIYEVEKIA
ncbi:MAG: FAD-dependent oxidoreductase [Saprospiraceae bacterium]|nr:FAD-dependent oxidoreductase [Saprospiraceae bacterium]